MYSGVQQLSSAPAVPPVEPQTPFPRAAYLSSLPSLLPPPEPTKTTVVMEAISNHAEEEVRRAVTFPFGFFVELLVHEPPRDPWAMRFHHTS